LTVVFGDLMPTDLAAVNEALRAMLGVA